MFAALRQVTYMPERRACIMPYEEVRTLWGEGTDSPLFWYEDGIGVCDPELTPTRGCVPPYTRGLTDPATGTVDNGIWLDAQGQCNAYYSPSNIQTPTPSGTKTSECPKGEGLILGIPKTCTTTTMKTVILGGIAVLFVVLIGGRRR